MNKTCPKCGAVRVGSYEWNERYACGTFFNTITEQYEIGYDCLLRQLAQRDARIAELESVIERLPKTADGVPVMPGDRVRKG